MQKELAKKEDVKNLPAFMTESWGTEDLDSSDIVIPRLLLTQAMSKVVAAGKANPGEIVNSVTGERLAGKQEQLELILIDTFKNWIITNKPKGGNKFEYQEVVSWKDGNPSWPFETVNADGSTTRRYQQINFYVLDAARLSDAGALPLLLTFRSSSYKTGKKVSTFGANAKLYKKPLGYKIVKLGSVSETNDMGTFNVFTAELGRTTTQEELEKAYNWYKVVRSGQAKVAPAEDETETVVKEF